MHAMASTENAPQGKASTTHCTSALSNSGPLLEPGKAVELMALFKVLANDTRLRLLHALARS